MGAPAKWWRVAGRRRGAEANGEGDEQELFYSTRTIMDRWMEIGRATVGSGKFSEPGAGAVDELRAVDRAAGVHAQVSYVSIRQSRNTHQSAEET